MSIHLHYASLAPLFLLSCLIYAKPVLATSEPKQTNVSATSEKVMIPLEVLLKITEGKDSEFVIQLKKEISLSHLKNDKFPAQTDFLFELAQPELLTALKAFGYYHPKITSKLDRTAKQTLASFEITLGKPMLVRTIDLQISGEAKDLPVWNQFRQFQLLLKPKTQFKHQDYTSTVNALTNIAVNQGFIDAGFNRREFRVYPHLNVVDVHLHLDTKTAYQFGEVSFQGSKQVNLSFLKRFVEFNSGDNYQQSEVSALQKSLIDSRYFGLVRVIPQYSEQQNKRIPIDVELEDSLQHRYNVGGGYGTDTGARALFGFENRLINQNGHNYQIESLFGERAQNFSFNYYIPGNRPALQHWNLGYGFEGTQSDNLNKSLNTLSADYYYQITPLWLINPFVSLQSETYRYLKENEETTQTLLVGISVKNRWVNNESYPTSGYRHNATLRASIDNLVSESQFGQIELGSRGVYSLMEFWRLHARIQTIFTVADKNQIIPATYRSLLGGETLRGYEFESVGIENDDGSVVGARNMVLGSIETDYRLSEYFGLGLFSDAGQVFDNESSSNLKVGAGLGLRAYTPVGMAKLDIAWPISEEEQPWRIHFSLGFDL